MTLSLTPVRLSPNGARIGYPGLRVGPGSVNVVARSHGIGTSAPQIVAVPTAIPGLDAIPVVLDPQYHYELEVYTQVNCVGLTITTSQVAWDVYYKVRAKSSGVWTDWVWTNNATHAFVQNAVPLLNQNSPFRDVVNNYVPSVLCDRIAFGVAGVPVGGAAVTIASAAAWARISEYAL